MKGILVRKHSFSTLSSSSEEGRKEGRIQDETSRREWKCIVKRNFLVTVGGWVHACVCICD